MSVQKVRGARSILDALVRVGGGLLVLGLAVLGASAPSAVDAWAGSGTVLVAPEGPALVESPTAPALAVEAVAARTPHTGPGVAGDVTLPPELPSTGAPTGTAA